MMNGPLDMEVIEELLDLGDGGDPELLVDLIRMFLENAPSKLESILDGVSEGDWEKVERAAHSLKSSSGNLGAVDLQDCADLFQVASRKEAADRLEESVAKLSKDFSTATDALRDLLKQYA